MAKRTLEGSQFDEAGESLGFLFWKAFNAWSRGLRAELEKVDLTQAQYSILATLGYLTSQSEAVSQQDVSAHLSMDKMMVSDVVKTLEKKGLLTRAPHPTDGRAFSLQLTADGKARLRRAVPLVESEDARFFAKLSAGDAKALLRCLARLCG